jgi:O-antigen/teichoic acid export membrane protein
MKLKTSILVTLMANLALAFSQWLLIANLNHTGNLDAVGQYSYSLALAGVFLTIGQMGLRQFLMSKSATTEHLEQIFTTRLITSISAWGLLVIYASLLVGEIYFWMVLLLGLAKIAENLSDIAHGFYQRNFQISSIARSRIGRAFLTPTIFLAVFFTTNSLQFACVALIVTWAMVFFIFDRRALQPHQCNLTRVNLVPEILRQAYPMGIASVLVILSVSIPLFTLAQFFEDLQVGQYASIFYFVTAGSLILQSALQVMSPIIVGHLNNNRFVNIRRIAIVCYLMALVFGATGVVLAEYSGEWVLVLVYGESFVGLGSLLVTAALINLVIAFQSVGGVVLTAHGIFKFQMIVMAVSVMVSALSSYYLISTYGVAGALYAGAITAAFNGICFAFRVIVELKKKDGQNTVEVS